MQTLALDKLHGDEEKAFFLACIENHDNVGMGKIAGRASFGLESGKQLGAREAGAFFGELKSFDRDCSPDDRVNGAIDHTHGASAEFAGNFVTTRFGERWNHELKRSRENTPLPRGLIP